ncbi:hypothetical protein BDB01DRAFT_778365 [Pilobolus umbonatus]|nr:hypothetical protein BDB01DRAFT_778365 [Pilobolus umbonatus]
MVSRKMVLNDNKVSPKDIPMICQKVVVSIRREKIKPAINVSLDSTPLDILHSSWKFINAFYTYSKFQSYFQLTDWGIDRLERALTQTHESSTKSTGDGSKQDLSHFIIQVVSPLLEPHERNQIQAQNYEHYLFQLFPGYGDSMDSLSISDKISLLKDIADVNIERMSSYFSKVKHIHKANNWRVQPLGSDYDGWVYWYFGDTRLYREIPLSTIKKEQDIMSMDDFTFQLVCSTIEEWSDLINKFQHAKGNQKELGRNLVEIGSSVILKLRAEETSRLKYEAKIRRMKELELLPKKKSRRLEIKFDEQARRKEMEKAKHQEMEKAKYQEMEEARHKEMEQVQRQIMELEVDSQQHSKYKNRREEDLDRVKERMQQGVDDYFDKKMDSDPDVDCLHLQWLQVIPSMSSPPAEIVKKLQEWISLVGNVNVIQKDSQLLFNINEEGFNHILFKNTIRVYLELCMHIFISQFVYNQLSDIHERWIVGSYDNIETFCSDLMALVRDNYHEHKDILSLLLSIFQP